jgi:hypothetical protein
VEFAAGNEDWTPNDIIPATETTNDEKSLASESSVDKDMLKVDRPLPTKLQSSRSLQWSLPFSQELLDPASDFMDTTPLKPPPNLFKEQPSFRRKQGEFLPRLFGRSPSVGEFAPHYPGVLDKTETQYDEDDDGLSNYQSVVSEITFDFGS